MRAARAVVAVMCAGAVVVGAAGQAGAETPSAACFDSCFSSPPQSQIERDIGMGMLKGGTAGLLTGNPLGALGGMMSGGIWGGLDSKGGTTDPKALAEWQKNSPLMFPPDRIGGGGHF